MKKTVALLLALILVFTLSISVLAYADGALTPESEPQPEPGPQPEPAPVQPSGSGTEDALRFSDSVLNAALFTRGEGGTGTCDLGNGKTIYTFLIGTLNTWRGRGVNTIRFLVNGAVYEISMADLLVSLKEAGADSVHIKLDEDGLHLYAKPKEFGGVNRVDIATLQPVADQPAAEQPAVGQPTGDQPAGDQSSAVQPAAQVDTAMQAKEGTGTAKAEQERKMQFDPFPEKTNRFDEQDRPLYTYEEKDDGTTVVTEYTYNGDKVLSVLTKTINPDGTGNGKYELNNAETLLSATGTMKYSNFGQNRQHAVENYDVASGDKKYTMTVLKSYKDGKLEEIVWRLSTGSETILRTETGSFNQHGTSSSGNSKWDDLYQADPGLRQVIDMIYDI